MQSGVPRPLDIDPMIEEAQGNADILKSLCDLTENQLAIGSSPRVEDLSDSETEWEQPENERNAFDVFV